VHDSRSGGPSYSSESNRPASFWEQHEPLFSIVPACYRVREYLPDFLRSLDEQDVDKQLCEVVVVVDGCPEGSGDVVREWMARTDYPVLLVEKDNGGVASARNVGFGLARGAWVMTPDPDDRLAPDYLSQLQRAIAAHPGETMFATRLYAVDAEGTHLPHPLDFRFDGPEDRLVDLAVDPEWLHLSGGTAVWSRAVIERAGLVFDERLRTGSDADFSIRYLLENGARYVAVPRAVYHYLKRADGSSIIGRAVKNYARYQVTIGYSHPAILDRAGDECPQWLANALLYAVFHLFRGNRRRNSPVYSLTSRQRSAIATALRANLRRIGRDRILGFRVVDLPAEIRYAWLAAVGPLTDSPVLRRVADATGGRRRVSFYSSEPQVRVSVTTSAQRQPAWSRKTRAVEFLGETWCYEHLLWVRAGADESIRLRSRTPGLSLDFDGRALTARVHRRRRGLTSPPLPAVVPVMPEPGSATTSPTTSEQVERAAAESDTSDASSTEPRRAVWVIDDDTGSRNTLPLYDGLRARRPDAPVWIVAQGDRYAQLRGTGTEQRDVVLRGSPEHLTLMRDCAWLLTPNPRAARHLSGGAAIARTWRTLYLPTAVEPMPDYRLLNASRLDATVVSSSYELDKLTASGSPYAIDGGDVFVTGHPYQDRLHRLAAARATRPTLLLALATRRDWPGPDDDWLGHLESTGYVDRWRALLHDARLDELRRRGGLQVSVVLPSGYDALAPLLDLPAWVEVPGSEHEREQAVAASVVCVTDYSPLALDAAFCGARTLFLRPDRDTAERESVLSLPTALDVEAAGLGPVVESVGEALTALDGMVEHTGDRRDDATASFFHHRDGDAVGRLLLVLEDEPGAEEGSEAGQRAAVRPPLSVVVRCGTDVSRLRRTLESLDEASVGGAVDTTLVLDEDTAKMREFVETFVAEHAGSTRLVVGDATDAVALGWQGARPGGWFCVVQPGAVLLPCAIDRLARTAALRPDLRVLAAVPAAPRRNPFPSREDITRNEISTGQAVVDLRDAPDAFALAGVCAFVRGDVGLEAAGGDLPGVGLWSAVLRGVLASDHRMGVLTEAVRTTGATTARLSITKRRDAERARLVDGILATLRDDLPDGPLDAATSGIVVFLALQALRYLGDRVWTAPGALQERRRDLAAVLERVPAAVLATSTWASGLAPRYALCSLAGQRPHPWEVSTGRGPSDLCYEGVPVARLATLGTTVLRADVTPAGVVVEALLTTYGTPDVDLVLVGPKKQVLRAVEAEPEAMMPDRYGHFVASTASYRRFLVPVRRGEAGWTLSVLNERTGRTDPCRDVSDGVRSPFAEADEQLTHSTQHGAVRLRDRRTLVITPPPKMLGREPSTLQRLRRTGATVLDRLRRRDDTGVVLITDRPRFGDDNGEALFRYVQRERRDLRGNTWLVLDPAAPSYPELSETGRVVHPRSPQHRELYLDARLLLSSHAGDVYNNPFHGEPREDYAAATDFTFVWLQHGITLNKVDSVFSRFLRGHDGVVVATEHEVRYASTPGFGLAGPRLLGTGFPRFDLLEDRSSSDAPVLLYMPTWRSWLTGDRQADGTSTAREDFATEEYYLHQRAFLTDPRVHDALRRANARIEMVLHPAMAAYTEVDAALASECVVVHEPGSVRYRDAFARGSALVTDYSSVFFDFAYLGKPVIFDHTDRARFRAEHYRDGIFDYDTSAPGPVLHSLDDLVDAVCELVGSGFTAATTYAERLGEVFLHRDRRSSERVIERALELDAWRRAGG